MENTVLECKKKTFFVKIIDMYCHIIISGELFGHREWEIHISAKDFLIPWYDLLLGTPFLVGQKLKFLKLSFEITHGPLDSTLWFTNSIICDLLEESPSALYQRYRVMHTLKYDSTVFISSKSQTYIASKLVELLLISGFHFSGLCKLIWQLDQYSQDQNELSWKF